MHRSLNLLSNVIASISMAVLLFGVASLASEAVAQSFNPCDLDQVCNRTWDCWQTDPIFPGCSSTPCYETYVCPCECEGITWCNCYSI